MALSLHSTGSCWLLCLTPADILTNQNLPKIWSERHVCKFLKYITLSVTIDTQHATWIRISSQFVFEENYARKITTVWFHYLTSWNISKGWEIIELVDIVGGVKMWVTWTNGTLTAACQRLHYGHVRRKFDTTYNWKILLIHVDPWLCPLLNNRLKHAFDKAVPSV